MLSKGGDMVLNFLLRDRLTQELLPDLSRIDLLALRDSCCTTAMVRLLLPLTSHLRKAFYQVRGIRRHVQAFEAIQELLLNLRLSMLCYRIESLDSGG